GDPRATVLMQWLHETHARSPELKFVEKVSAAAVAAIGAGPNIDFALAGLGPILRLPRGAPLTIFAVARTIGWIGHAIEQYATGQLIRPRAKYVGVAPAGPGGAFQPAGNPTSGLTGE